MYAYRELKPRLLAKVRRCYRRFVPPPEAAVVGFKQAAVENLTLPERFNALITSPPYMNALDYGRDNRLRLWFIDPAHVDRVDNGVTQRQKAFAEAITSLGAKIEPRLSSRGYCVFVVGEQFRRSFEAHPSDAAIHIMHHQTPSLRLKRVIVDEIPDVRRTRRECQGVRTEHILVFQRT